MVNFNQTHNYCTQVYTKKSIKHNIYTLRIIKILRASVIKTNAFTSIKNILFDFRSEY